LGGAEDKVAAMTPTPELLALRDVCARLDGAGIAYMLTGSLAMSFYARPRMTRDIDLVIALEAAEAERLDGSADDPLAQEVRFLSATAALRQNDPLIAAQLIGDLNRRLDHETSDLASVTEDLFGLLAPRVYLEEQPGPGRVTRVGIEGLPGHTYEIQRSTDLKIWTTVGTQTLVGATAILNDPATPTGTARFYRVIWTR